jgi:ABC-2 type transport system permease protein
MNHFVLASTTLWQREIVRFFRQRSRVIGALGPPILFWFLIGSGLGNSFHVARIDTGGISYLQYFFPGTVSLIVLFTAIFSTISVIEDRHEGFLQSVLVAPLSRVGLVLGKILGGATLAIIQAVIFLLLAPVAGIHVPLAAMPYVFLVLALMSFSLTGLGFLLAWRLDSTQGFHSIMNLLLIPMWLLSGALFPASGAAGWIRLIMELNPLTYGVSALQQSLQVNGRALSAGMASPQICVLVSLAFAVVMFAASLWSVRKN